MGRQATTNLAALPSHVTLAGGSNLAASTL
jgi:hypothetical protein